MSSCITKYTLEQDAFLEEHFFLPWLLSWLFLNRFQARNGFLEETTTSKKVNYPDAVSLAHKLNCCSSSSKKYAGKSDSDTILLPNLNNLF